MELTYTDLRQKEVINTADGKRLGRINDVVFVYPCGQISGFVVPGCKSFNIFKSNAEIFLPLSCITKIGEDVVLVCLQHTSGAVPNNSCLNSKGNCDSTSSSRNNSGSKTDFEDYE